MFDPVTSALTQATIRYWEESLQARVAVQEFLERAEAGLPPSSLTKSAVVSPYETSALASYPLEGRIYLAADGSLRLSVPNALGIGLFDAAAASGVELPKDQTGRYRASVLIMTPEEVRRVGGPDAISERGHTARYSLLSIGSERSGDPDGLVYYLVLRSPALSALRRSYGLSSQPSVTGNEFRLPFALRRSRVLYSDPQVTKQVKQVKQGASVARGISGLPNFSFQSLLSESERLEKELLRSVNDLASSYLSSSGGSSQQTGSRLLDSDALEDAVASWLEGKESSPPSGKSKVQSSPSSSPSSSSPSPSSSDRSEDLFRERKRVLQQLLQAKSYSDRKQYQQKHTILHSLLSERPDEFVIDSVDPNGFLGLTHLPTRFKIHAPPWVLPADKKIRHLSSESAKVTPSQAAQKVKTYA